MEGKLDGMCCLAKSMSSYTGAETEAEDELSKKEKKSRDRPRRTRMAVADGRTAACTVLCCIDCIGTAHAVLPYL